MFWCSRDLVLHRSIQPIPAIEKPLSLDTLAQMLARIWDAGDQPHFAFSISVAGWTSFCISARSLFLPTAGFYAWNRPKQLRYRSLPLTYQILFILA